MTRTSGVSTLRSRRAAALTAVALGVGLLVVTPAVRLFSGAPAGERILKRFTPTFSRAGLAALQGNFAIVRAMSDQLFEATLPAVRSELGLSERQLAARYPALAIGARDIPPAVRFVAPKIPLIVGARADFDTSRNAPGFLGLRPTAAPWLMMGVGALLVALGATALWRPVRATAALLAAAGAALVAVPLALSLPHQSDAAAHLGRVGKITLSLEAAATALRTTNETGALIDEVEKRVVPDLAARTHSSPAAAVRTLDRSYPAVARGLALWPNDLRPGSYALVANMRASLTDYKRVNAIPVEALPWLVIGPGIALLLVSGLALAPLGAPARRGRSPRPARATAA